MKDNNTTKTTHKTGLRLITHYMPDAPAVSLYIFVHTGSRFEKPQENGMAHFFEHMVFKGTPQRPTPHQISYELELIGADVNASTGREYTNYYIKCLKNNLDKGAEILFDAFLNSLLDPVELEKERKVIKEEMKMYDDDPDSFISEKMIENLYSHDVYGAPVLGTENTLDTINHENMREFVKSHYSFQNTVIIATGNITHLELEKLIERYFDTTQYTNQDLVTVDYVGDRFEKSEYVYYKDVQQAQLRLSTYSVPFEHPDKSKITVAFDMLGSGMGSKLFIEIREKLGLAYSIYSYDSHWSKSGYICIGAGLMCEKIPLVKEICMQEMQKLSEGKFDNNDLERAKAIAKASLLMDMDTTDAWAWFLGMRECVYGKLITVEEIINSIEQVERNDIQTIMDEYVNKNWQTNIVQSGVINSL